MTAFARDDNITTDFQKEARKAWTEFMWTSYMLCLFCNKCTILLTINLFETQFYPEDGTNKCSRNIGCTSKIDVG